MLKVRASATGRVRAVRVEAKQWASKGGVLIPPAWNKRVVVPEVEPRDTPKVSEGANERLCSNWGASLCLCARALCDTAPIPRGPRQDSMRIATREGSLEVLSAWGPARGIARVPLGRPARAAGLGARDDAPPPRRRLAAAAAARRRRAPGGARGARGARRRGALQGADPAADAAGAPARRASAG